MQEIQAKQVYDMYDMYDASLARHVNYASNLRQTI